MYKSSIMYYSFVYKTNNISIITRSVTLVNYVIFMIKSHRNNKTGKENCRITGSDQGQPMNLVDIFGPDPSLTKIRPNPLS